MKTAGQALEYERTPIIKLTGKTDLRRSINREKREKMLLSEANLLQVTKHICKRYEQQLFWLGFALGWFFTFWQYFNK